MKIIIPVAGIGKRLKPHTLNHPKPLLHVAGKAILAYIIEPILKLNPDEVIFVIGFKGAQIKEYVEKHYDFKATFVEQDQLLGLGYAIHLALEKIKNAPVLIILGDTIVECDLEKFIASGENVLGVRQVDDPKRFGIAEIENNRVIRVEEKPAQPKTNMALIGLYYFKESLKLKEHLKKVIDGGHTTSGEIQLTDALESLIAGGTVFAPYEVQDWYDCGKKETMLATNKHLLKNMTTPPADRNSVFIPPVYVAPTAKVTNSVIGPNVSISDDAVISNCIIKNTIIGYRANVRNLIIKDSLIARDTVVKGDTKIFNIGDSSEIDYS